MLRKAFNVFAGLFLVLNLVTRLYALYNYGYMVNLFLLSGMVIVLTVWLRPDFLKKLCFLLGLSLPLYGFQSYTLYNQIFECLLILLGCLLLFDMNAERKQQNNPGQPGAMLIAYVALALLSLQVLPVLSFVDTFTLWGLFDFFNSVFSARPDNPLYSLAAWNRLAIFVLLIVLLNRNRNAADLYRKIFAGSAAAVIVAALAGLLNQFGSISLTWYRPKFLDASGIDRLQSFFGNPGWCAQFIVICTPLVLLLTGRWRRRLPWLLSFTTVLVLIGISLLLTGSRTSWLVFLPMIFFCYFTLLLYTGSKRGERVSLKRIRRCAVGVLRGVLLVCLVGAAAFWAATRYTSPEHHPGPESRGEYLLERMHTLTMPEERLKVWHESLALLAESPIFGMGYESYRWHQEIMRTIPDSRFAKQRQTTVNWDTAHNFYMQLALSNGIIGLSIWLLLMVYVACLLYQDAVTEGNLQSFALLGVLAAFHLYGFTQSMQYIASIWFLVFLIAGYAMLPERQLIIPGLIKVGRYMVFASLLAVISGGIVYGQNFQSRQLAKRYGLPVYGLDRGSEQYRGFYQKEDWGDKGTFRWSGRTAEIMLRNTGVVRFDFVCNAPGLNSFPLTLEVTRDEIPVDRYTFRRTGKVTRSYFIPPLDGEQSTSMLRFHVSRTWVPKAAGMGDDTRILGIAVSAPVFIGSRPLQDLGFSRWSLTQGMAVAGVDVVSPLRYRWTNSSALLPLKKYQATGLTILMKTEHPYVVQQPVKVALAGASGIKKEVVLKDHAWHEMFISAQQAERMQYLSFVVGRTWNPLLDGYFNDPRNLGIAVAIKQGRKQ